MVVCKDVIHAYNAPIPAAKTQEMDGIYMSQSREIPMDAAKAAHSALSIYGFKKKVI